VEWPTSTFGEAVDLVRLLGLGAVQFLDLVDVGSFVECATQSCLELRVVGFRVAFFPTTSVLGPLLPDTQTISRSPELCHLSSFQYMQYDQNAAVLRHWPCKAFASRICLKVRSHRMRGVALGREVAVRCGMRQK